MTKSKAPSIQNSTGMSLDGAFVHKSLLNWYEHHEKPLPWRVLWKKHKDPWHIWVSEIMLQQTVIKAVIPVYERFLLQYPSPTALANATTEDVRLAVRGLGYYRRFDFLHRAAKKIQADGQQLPQDHDTWLALPGIGEYTAAAISSITTDAPYGVVDGNVERVLCRFLDIRLPGNTPHIKKFFKQQMDAICTMGRSGAFNQAVMELGQSVCTPTNPNCKGCPIRQKCKAFKNSSQHLAPAMKVKPEMVDVKLKLTITISKSGIMVLERPSAAKFLRKTWGFPTFIECNKSFFSDGDDQRKWQSTAMKKIGSIKHSITKHRIVAEVFIASSREITKNSSIKYLKLDEVERNLVSNLDRKAWNLYLKTL